METIETESTPIQALVKNIDKCLKDNENIYTPHQLGFVEGLIQARRACESLLDYEKTDLGKAYDAGRAEQTSKSAEQFLLETYGKIELPEEPAFNDKANQLNDNSFRSLMSENARSFVISRSRFSRRVFYVFMTLSIFISTVLSGAWFIISFQFPRLKTIPKDVSKKTEDLEDFLNL